jgi:hypothetical protein
MPKSDYPDRTLETRVREAGARVAVMWQMRGPKDTGVAWLECFQIGERGDLVIVETFKHGGWNAFSAPHSNSVNATVADTLERCGVRKVRSVKIVKVTDGYFAQGLMDDGATPFNAIGPSANFPTAAEVIAAIDAINAERGPTYRVEGVHR